MISDMVKVTCFIQRVAIELKVFGKTIDLMERLPSSTKVKTLNHAFSKWTYQFLPTIRESL